jgi:hypothetical protein
VPCYLTSYSVPKWALTNARGRARADGRWCNVRPLLHRGRRSLVRPRSQQSLTQGSGLLEPWTLLLVLLCCLFKWALAKVSLGSRTLRKTTPRCGLFPPMCVVDPVCRAPVVYQGILGHTSKARVQSFHYRGRSPSWARDGVAVGKRCMCLWPHLSLACFQATRVASGERALGTPSAAP